MFGIHGTPFIFINGTPLAEPLFGEYIEKRFAEEISKADGLLAKGVKPEEVYSEMVKAGEAQVPARQETPQMPPGFGGDGPEGGMPGGGMFGGGMFGGGPTPQ